MGMFDAPGEVVNKPDTPEEEENQETGFSTDVEGVKAHDVVKQGGNEFPVFDCSGEEFFQNMSTGRKRLRFKSGTAAQQYMSGTKYKKPFFIRTTNDKGTFTRKIK